MGGQILSSEYIYQGGLLNLRVDRLLLSNGNEVVREIVEHPGAVAIVPVDSAGNVTLVKQFREATLREMLEVPAGTLKRGEDPAQCAVRELEEETGLSADTMQPIGGFFVSPGYCNEFIHAFLATGLTEGTMHTDEDEYVELVKLPLKDAVSKCLAGEILDSKSITCLLLAERLL